MASGAVRELITKVKFQIDKASLSQANKAAQDVKKKLNDIAQKATKVTITANGAQATSTLARIKGQLNALRGKVTTAYVDVKQRGGKIGAGIAENGLGSGIAGVAGVIGGGMAVSQIKEAADEMMNLDGRLRTVTKTEQERRALEEELFRLGQKTRQPLSSLGDLYFKVARASEEMGFAQKDNLKVTETVSKALIVGGASAQEASATILQLGQALGSGRLQGDELRSLDENASILMGHIAKYFKTNVAGLKQMGAQGQLTSDEVMRAILSAGNAIDDEFAKMPMTFGQSMNVMKNSWNRFILGVEQKSSVFSLIARSFTKAFENMGKKMENFLTLMGNENTPQYNQVAAENPGMAKLVANLKKLSDMFDGLDGKTGNLDEQIGNLIEVFMKIAMVAVPLLAIIGLIDGIIMLLSPFIGLVTSIGSTIMGVLGPILSVGLGPLLAILGAIASVIYFVGENWETVVSWFQPGIDSMMDGIAQLQSAWENLQPFIAAITPLLQAIATVIGGAIVGAVSLLWRIFTAAFNAIAGLINWVAGLLGGLGDTIQWIAGGLSGLIDKAAQFIGMRGAINGTNEAMIQGWMNRGSGGTNNQTQNNTFNLTSDTQLAPAMQSTQTYFAYD